MVGQQGHPLATFPKELHLDVVLIPLLANSFWRQWELRIYDKLRTDSAYLISEVSVSQRVTPMVKKLVSSHFAKTPWKDEESLSHTLASGRLGRISIFVFVFGTTCTSSTAGYCPVFFA